MSERERQRAKDATGGGEGGRAETGSEGAAGAAPPSPKTRYGSCPSLIHAWMAAWSAAVVHAGLAASVVGLPEHPLPSGM